MTDDRCVILFVPLLIIENRRHPFCYATTATAGNRQQATGKRARSYDVRVGNKQQHP
jgi:hypothetical protein